MTGTMGVDQQPIIALVNFNKETSAVIKTCNFNNMQLMHFINETEMVSIWQVRRLNIVAIISCNEILSTNGVNIKNLTNKKFPRVPVFLLITYFNDN
ncbi:MAG TPA: hypothetical protein VGC01_13445, partial [Mucilaginibacter sp.]